MRRRELLAALAGGSTPESPENPDDPTVSQFANRVLPKVQRTTAGVEPCTGTWGSDQLLHLLRRTMFGAAKAEGADRLEGPPECRHDHRGNDPDVRRYTTRRDQQDLFCQVRGTVIVGGVDGDRELNELIAMIFGQPETAKFLCRELYRWFVYYVIEDWTEANIIAPTNTTKLNAVKGKLKALLAFKMEMPEFQLM